MNKKAIVLLSGGLDSTLSIKVLLEQGIEIIALHFLTPFYCSHCSSGLCSSPFCYPRNIAQKFGIKLKVIRLGREYLKMVKNPKYGYGRNINPCIDCKILMLKKAKVLMEKISTSFIATGEVLGQRPMSQYKNAMKLIEDEAGLSGMILRPLSAKLLPPTIPEKLGIVNRERLLGLSGRSRKAQMQLASNYGITDYLTPAGGCLLTDPGFSKRLKDLFKYTNSPGLNDIELLKIGRHFRLKDTTKCIVGRNKEENERLQNLVRKGDGLLEVPDYSSPLVLIRGKIDNEIISKSCQICIRYADAPKHKKIKVVYKIDKQIGSIRETSIEDKELEALRI